MIAPFSLKIPRLEFGAGKIKILPSAIKNYGSKVLLITGRNSLRESGLFGVIISVLEKNGIAHFHEIVSTEPSPDQIDSIAAEYSRSDISCVCAIGGGSAIDTAKAVAAMIMEGISVTNFMESVGDKTPSGKTLPVIAVPTTAGTGTEATKNAVISKVGINGYKKSIRHDNYIPEVAIIDPELTLSCSRSVSAASGLDALLQLFESYVSTKATPATDALAIDAIRRAVKALPAVCTDQPHDIALRSELSYAAFVSGITLAHAGLGTAHGLAAETGARINVPHGVVCGNILAPWVEKTVRKLHVQGKTEYLNKFLDIGRFFSDESIKNPDIILDSLVNGLRGLTRVVGLDPLKNYGFTRADVEFIAETSADKCNPVSFTATERLEIMLAALA